MTKTRKIRPNILFRVNQAIFLCFERGGDLCLETKVVYVFMWLKYGGN